MGYINSFLTLPELPDVISYIILIGLFIFDYFIKKFVKKDNINTLFKVKMRTDELENAIKEFKEEKKQLEKERHQIRREFRAIKKAIKQEANNSHELVANGTANEIAKMLEDGEEEDGKELS